jgi:carboxyl-terminal processing protease
MIKKSFILSVLFIAGLFVFTGGSCEPEQTLGGSSDSTPYTSAKVRSFKVDASLGPVIEKISHGQMEEADQLLAAKGTSRAAGQLKILLNHYAQLQAYRRTQRQQAYEEQMDELEKLKEQLAGRDPNENETDEIMLAVVRAREYAVDARKEEVTSDPFVQKVLRQMQRRADAYEQEGKWLDAYTHNYYWLTALYEDNEAYKDKADELTELATIELSLKDSSCGETAAERYEGIEPEMFLRALKLLENSYVTVVDYGDMAQEGLERCRRLSRVLEKTTEALAWKASPGAIREWTAGLKAIQARVDESAADGASMSREMLEGIFEDVLALNSITLGLPEEVAVAQFGEASFAALDPFTNLVWPWQVKDFEKNMTQQFTGIGVEISKATGILKITSLLPDTPAYRAGLDAEDEIVAVDGEPTKDMTIYCVVDKITGPKNTRVTLTIRRPSTGEVKNYTITRDRIVVDPLRGWTRDAAGQWDYMIDPANGIGYVRLMQFTEKSGPDIDSVLRQLEKEGLSGLVLDLRFNTGGYLQAAAEVVDLFLDDGVIVKSNPRHGFSNYEFAHRSGTHPDYPLVVLINGVSASASEIVAGALQDPKYQRAILVGERTYGKGSVQVITSYTGDGSQMKYTMAYYHLPSDQRVKNRYQIEKMGRKDWGIAPDIEVKMLSNEVRKMLDIQRDNDVLFQDGHETDGGRSRRHALEETLRADPQLSVGLMVVRSRLAATGQSLVLKDDLYEQSPETVNAQS